MSRNMDRRATGLRNGRVTPTQDRIHDTSRVGLALTFTGTTIAKPFDSPPHIRHMTCCFVYIYMYIDERR